jgi:hypothetical protein
VHRLKEEEEDSAIPRCGHMANQWLGHTMVLYSQVQTPGLELGIMLAEVPSGFPSSAATVARNSALAWWAAQCRFESRRPRGAALGSSTRIPSIPAQDHF